MSGLTTPDDDGFGARCRRRRSRAVAETPRSAEDGGVRTRRRDGRGHRVRGQRTTTGPPHLAEARWVDRDLRALFSCPKARPACKEELGEILSRDQMLDTTDWPTHALVRAVRDHAALEVHAVDGCTGLRGRRTRPADPLRPISPDRQGSDADQQPRLDDRLLADDSSARVRQPQSPQA